MRLKPISKVRSKDEARSIAMEWQEESSQKSMSYGELARDQRYLEKLGKKFKLTEEFRENGII